MKLIKCALIFLCVLFHLQVSELEDKSVNRSDYILRGNDASIEKYPFMVSLQKRRQHFCGGTIASVHWILTSANCLKRVTFLTTCSLKIIAGSSHSVESYFDRPTKQKRKASKCYIHEGYDSRKKFNDIGMILLDEPFELSNSVQVVKLPRDIYVKQDLSSKFRECTFIGWGQNTMNESLPFILNNLRSVTLRPMSHSYCKKARLTKMTSNIRKTHLCTLPKYMEIGVSKGDNGGPMICQVQLVPRTVRSPGIAITETWRTWRQVRVADVPRQESRTRTHRRSPLDSKTFVNDYCECYNKLIRWRAGGKMKYEGHSERQK
ncbi:chymotrypsin-1-like [Ctenocephalides felis]|uniref:chymotrypsin-1-like n=1 Tax=Ctenocephalides felis TaxID=7515 RepID=UPI000E6E4E1E|nr:chymotrypsin-1-like [Ctenocephalides felis]